MLLIVGNLLPASAQRIVTNMDFGWRFRLGTADVHELDTTSWRIVDLPHDFQIEQPWVAPAPDEKANTSDPAANVKSRLSPRGFKEMGEGWYVKSFMAPDSWKKLRTLIDFEGIMYVGDVYLNGERIGGTDYGYVGFEIDLTSHLRYGQRNVIAVRASTSKPENSRWYTGGGLFRDVWLVQTPPEMYFVRHPLYITTKDNRFVNLQIGVANYTRQDSILLKVDIFDPQHKLVYQKQQPLKFMRKMKTNELKWPEISLPSPQLWSPEHPNLYHVRVSLLNKEGQTIDQTESRFGVRTVEIGPSFGLKINGKKVLLKGIANHHSLGALGAAAYPRAMEKRLRLLKDFGFNHVRTSHNPYSTSFLDLCDSLGILVVDELYDKWLDKFAGGRKPWMEIWPYDLKEWICRDRNHPSVIVWSLGNELQTYANLPFEDWGVTPYRMMKPVLQRYDNTRKITVAMHPRGRSLTTDSLPAPLVMETDISAYNYRYMYFPGDGRRFPWMTFYQSEANTTDMGRNFFAMDRNKVMGLAYWGQIDYLGESNGWPAKGWVGGSFDISLQPKPKAWLLRSMFKEDEPVVHVAVVENRDKGEMWNGIRIRNDGMSENWNRQQGEIVDLNVYTNCDSVVLLLNGKEVARQVNPIDNPAHRNQLRFSKIAYVPGRLEAVGYRNGQPAARHQLETTNKAVRLRLTPDIENWKADGQDLMHVRVEAVDNKGRRVYNVSDKLHFAVEGPARIVAVDNGDMDSNELHVATERSLYNGSALVILRAGRQSGKVTLTVSSDNFKSQKLKFKTE